MGNLLRMEWYRSVRRSSVFVLAGFLLVVAVSGMFDWYSGARDYNSDNEFYRISHTTMEEEEEEVQLRAIWKATWSETMRANYNVAVILIVLLVSFYVGMDFEKGRIAEEIAAGYGRGRIFWSKYLFLAALCTVLFLLGGLIHFFIKPEIYAGYLRMSDLPYFFYYAANAALACFGTAAVCVSGAFLTGNRWAALAANTLLLWLRGKLMEPILAGDSYELMADRFRYFWEQNYRFRFDAKWAAVSVCIGLLLLLISRKVFSGQDVRNV